MTKRRTSMFLHSIRLRTFGLALGGAMLFFFIAGALDFLGRKDADEKAFVLAGQQRAATVAAMASAPGKPLAALASAVASQADVLEVTFRSHDGKTIVQQTRPNQGDTPGRVFKAQTRLSSGDECILELHLAETRRVDGHDRIVWPFAVLALLFAGVLFFVLGRLLVDPLKKLVRSARELADDRDLDAPITLRAEGCTELREVINILNTMSRHTFDVKKKLEDKVNHANAALVSTVKQLQTRTAELRERTQELEVALEENKRLATTDSLTGLHNRRYFDERLGNALARLRRTKQPISMLLFDIDKFKHINDTLGHGAGDAILKNLARLVKSRTRASDVFSRLGGDEFALIMENTNLPHAKKLGDELLASVVAHHFTFESHTIPVTLSIGIAEFDQSPRDEKIIYKVSDDALYEAKRNGRNQVVAHSFGPNGDRFIATPEKPV